jgi:hypothetical protein
VFRPLFAALPILFAGLVMAEPPAVAKLSVLSTGKLMLDGRPSNLQKLDAELARLKAVGGAVWYYRENPASEPPPQAMAAIELVMRHGLPLSMSSKPDFSDYIDGNGRSHPRTASPPGR